MPPKEYEGPDALRIDDGTESPSLMSVRTIPGVVVEFPAGYNYPGVGFVKSADDASYLQFKAPGSSTWGKPVYVPSDTTYVLPDGEDESKYIRVQVYTDYLVTQVSSAADGSAELGFVNPITGETIADETNTDYVPGWYSRSEIDSFFEGETDNKKKQVDWSSIVGDPADAIEAGNNLEWATNTLNVVDSPSFFDVTLAGQLLPRDIDTAEPTGFAFSDNTESTIAFDDGTRTFTIAPVGADFSYYYEGKHYSVTAPDTVVITDTEGLHYIYYNASGVLVSTLSFPGWDKAWVAMIQWDAANNAGILLNERHKFHNADIHYRDHFAMGALWTSGFAIDGYTLATDSNAGVTFGLDTGIFCDEDNRHEHAADADPATIPVFYLDGAGADVRWDTGTDYAFKNTGAGRINWNENNGGTWQQTQCTDNYHVAYFVCAWTNDGGDHKFISIQGQRQDQKLANAIINNEFGDLELGGFGPELRPLHMIIVQSKNSFGGDRKAKIQYVEDIRAINVPAGAAASQGTHSRLHALDDTSDHALGGLTAARLLATDADSMASADLSSWVTGTGSQITVTDDADGTITLSVPSPFAVETVQFDHAEEITLAHGCIFGNWIGIGVTPTVAFQILGAGNQSIIVESSSGEARLNLKAYLNKSSFVRFYENNVEKGHIGHDDDTNIFTIGGANTVAGTSYNIAIDISGNVGIRTGTPSRALDVNGIIRSNTGGNRFEAIGGPGGTGYYIFGDTDDTDVGWIRYDHSTNTMGFRTNASATMRLTIDSLGNIGTPSGGIFSINHIAEQGGAHTIVFDNIITATNNIVLDDGSGDSPKLSFIGGSNGDEIFIKLDNDAIAGHSDFLLILADNQGESVFKILDSGNNPRFTVDSDGIVTLIGSGVNLHIDSTTDASLKLDKSAANRKSYTEYDIAGVPKWYHGLPDSDNFGAGDEFFIGQAVTGANAALYINLNNNVLLTSLVGIGIAPTNIFDIADSDENVIQTITSYDTGPKSAQLHLRISNHETIGTIVETVNDQRLGEIWFLGVDTGSNFDRGALISAVQDGAAGTRVPTRLTLETWTVTAKNTDQLVLLSDGRVSMSGIFEAEQTIKIKERAAAAGDTAAYGQLWVKDTTPCELWFTDDAGADTQIV